MPRKLWEHDDPKSTEIFTFMKDINPEFEVMSETVLGFQ